MLAIKGMRSDMTCRGKQYKIKEVYHEEDNELCFSGFHGCLNPLEVLRYYSVGNNSRYFLVDISDNVLQEPDSSKICGRTIRIIEELSIETLADMFLDYLVKLDNDKTNPISIETNRFKASFENIDYITNRFSLFFLIGDNCLIGKNFNYIQGQYFNYLIYKNNNVINSDNFNKGIVNSNNILTLQFTNSFLVNMDNYISMTGENQIISRNNNIIKGDNYNQIIVNFENQIQVENRNCIIGSTNNNIKANNGNNINSESGNTIEMYNDNCCFAITRNYIKGNDHNNIITTGKDNIIDTGKDTCCINKEYTYTTTKNNSKIITHGVTCVGEDSIVVINQSGSYVKAGKRSVIVLVEYDEKERISFHKIVIVDGIQMKANTPYYYVDNELKEITSTEWNNAMIQCGGK